MGALRRLRAAAVVSALCAVPVLAQGEGPLFGADPSAPIDLAVHIGTDAPRLFAPVSVTLDLWWQAGAEPRFDPEIPEDFEGSVRALADRPFAGGSWRRYQLELRPLCAGELILPSYVAALAEQEITATTAEQTLQVASVLDEHSFDLEDPGALFAPRTPVATWLVPVLVVLGLVGALGLWRWFSRRRTGPAPAISTPVPAHVRALRALVTLREAPRETPAQVEDFYVRVSQVLRVYLEERFGLHAPERTTDEFLPEVEASGLLGSSQQQHLRGFLQRCDLVKFAGDLPDRQTHDEVLATAEQLVESTRADAAVATERPMEVVG